MLSTDSMSVLGCTANATGPVVVLPVLSCTVNVAVEFPAVVGVPVTAPVAGLLRFNPAGSAPPKSDQVNGAVPPVVARVAE